MSPEWVTAACAFTALVGGGIWAAVNYFASKEQTKALFKIIEKLQAELGEVKNIATTAISNQEYYRLHIEDQKKVIERNDTLLRSVEPLMMELAKKVS